MKTAISIPDSIFNSAEHLAKRLGLSRSELYVRAISIYLENNKNKKVTEKLDDIYSDKNNSKLDMKLVLAQTKSINREDW